MHLALVLASGWLGWPVLASVSLAPADTSSLAQELEARVPRVHLPWQPTAAAAGEGVAAHPQPGKAQGTARPPLPLSVCGASSPLPPYTEAPATTSSPLQALDMAERCGGIAETSGRDSSGRCLACLPPLPTTFIVDPWFRDQFQLAHPTAAYLQLLDLVPQASEKRARGGWAGHLVIRCPSPATPPGVLRHRGAAAAPGGTPVAGDGAGVQAPEPGAAALATRGEGKMGRWELLPATCLP